MASDGKLEILIGISIFLVISILLIILCILCLICCVWISFYCSSEEEAEGNSGLNQKFLIISRLLASTDFQETQRKFNSSQSLVMFLLRIHRHQTLSMDRQPAVRPSKLPRLSITIGTAAIYSKWL